MSRLAIPVSDSDHAQGPKGAPVTLVEYGDYQCPYCGAAHPVVKALQGELGGELRFVFRNFPLTQAHEHALLAAQAAEAAAMAGEDKFWRMHDTLFEHQESLELPDLIGYAREMGLDAAQFGRDLSAGTFAPRVKSDFRGGVRSGVNGTPTFFIDGVRFDGEAAREALGHALRGAAQARQAH